MGFGFLRRDQAFLVQIDQMLAKDAHATAGRPLRHQ
jgi:hypothetical protein